MRLSFPLLTLAILSLAGCGGGGSSSGASTASVFITDDPNPDFDAVWVKVEEVSVLRGGVQVAGGLILGGDGEARNLASLHDSTGPIFSYLGKLGLHLKAGDQIHVVLSEDVTIHKVSTGTNVAAKIIGAVGGKKGYDYYKAQSDGRVRVACDLSQWTLSGTDLTIPSASIGEAPAASTMRHARDTVSGQASGVTRKGKEKWIEIQGWDWSSNADTGVYNADGSLSPTIADGVFLRATGTYSDASGRFVADTIEIDPRLPNATCSGTLVDSGDGSSNQLFKLRTASFASPSINVVLEGESTKAFLGGVSVTPEQFAAGVTAGSEIDCTGTFDAGTGIFTLDTVHASKTSEAKNNISGTFRSSNSGGIVVEPATWEGFDFDARQTLPLSVTGTSAFYIGSEIVTETAFLTAVKGGATVTATFTVKQGHTGYDLAKGTKM